MITFIDLAGHHKYLKTTIFGLTSYCPDFAMLVVSANTGIGLYPLILLSPRFCKKLNIMGAWPFRSAKLNVKWSECVAGTQAGNTDLLMSDVLQLACVYVIRTSIPSTLQTFDICAYVTHHLSQHSSWPPPSHPPLTLLVPKYLKYHPFMSESTDTPKAALRFISCEFGKPDIGSHLKLCP